MPPFFVPCSGISPLKTVDAPGAIGANRKGAGGWEGVQHAGVSLPRPGQVTSLPESDPAASSHTPLIAPMGAGAGGVGGQLQQSHMQLQLTTGNQVCSP